MEIINYVLRQFVDFIVGATVFLFFITLILLITKPKTKRKIIKNCGTCFYEYGLSSACCNCSRCCNWKKGER